MGKLMDMLPQIEAEIRNRDLLTYLGCVRLGCSVSMQDAIVRCGRWVRHNGETRFFGSVLDQDLLAVRPDVRRPPVASIPYDIASWIREGHTAIAVKHESAHQVAVDDDPWRQHAAMLAGID